MFFLSIKIKLILDLARWPNTDSRIIDKHKQMYCDSHSQKMYTELVADNGPHLVSLALESDVWPRAVDVRRPMSDPGR